MRGMVTTSLFLVFVSGPVQMGGTPLGGGWTYQGRLTSLGSPLNGAADLQFSLWDAATDGNQVGATVARSDVTVTNGLFTVQLDFGTDVFDGQARWLQIAVRSPHDPGGTQPYTILNPRQPLTPSPYSLQTRGLFVNATGDRIGIGTVAPGSSLEVNGGVRARGGAPGASGTSNHGYAFGAPGDNDSGLFSLANGEVSIYTDSAERVKFNSQGIQFPNGSTQNRNQFIASLATAVDFGVIPAGGRSAAAGTLTGAMPGDVVIVSPNADVPYPFILFGAYSPAPNQIRFLIQNAGSLPADPPSFGVSIVVIRP